MRRRMLSAIALAAMLVLGGGVAASAQATPEITADPASVEVGVETTVTATGLGGLETASFGLGDPSGGTLTDPATGASGTSLEVAVSDGSATVRFAATREGDAVVSVGTGETSLAQATVSVTPPAPSPTAEPSVTTEPTPTPTPEPSMTTMDGGDDGVVPDWAVIVIIVLAVLVLAAIIVIVVLAARRRGSGRSRS